jgi:predicted ArsR family transcriptional regulator
VLVTLNQNGLGSQRAEIVRLLRSRGEVSADELAVELGVTKQCVRKHLDVLERGGYVSHEAARRERGRPSYLYRLTEKADELFPKEYRFFSASILRQVDGAWGEEGLDRIFCGCAREMVERIRPELTGLGFDDRVRKLASIIDGLGYQATVEKLSDGSYLISEWNCPLSDLAREYTQICERELFVYRELLETEVYRQSRIAAGDGSCSYRVLRPATAGV